MKFYYKVADKSHAIIKEHRDKAGNITEREHICTFIDGTFETDDERIIGFLKDRPDLFTWEEEDKEKELSYREIVEKAKGLGISVYRKKKLELLKEINEKEVMSYEIS